MGVHGLVRLYGHLWRWNVGTNLCENKFRKQNSVHIVFHSNLKLYLMWNHFCCRPVSQFCSYTYRCLNPMEKEAGLVEEIYWAALVKPEEKSRSCNKQSCPPGILSYILSSKFCRILQQMTYMSRDDKYLQHSLSRYDLFRTLSLHLVDCKLDCNTQQNQKDILIS